jgi:carbon-monoxide dehydrogenase medium subunit
MHRTLRPFELFEPDSLEEAIRISGEFGDRGKILAGGLDLISKMRRWQMHPKALVSILNIPGLDYIQGNGAGDVLVGALTTLRAMELSPAIRNHHEMLYEAIHQIASIQVKTMGTVVGNICVATPASDVTTALMALGAELEITGHSGKKTVSLERFYQGLEQTILEPGHIVTEIRIPAMPAGSGGAFLKQAHTAACIAKVNVAVMMHLDNDICKEVRIALGSVAPTVVRATQAEEMLRGIAPDAEAIDGAASSAADNVTPISDLRSTAEYRKEMVGVLVKRGIEKASERAKANS